MLTMRNLHRSFAIPIAVFSLVHLANHLVSLMSISWHFAFMEKARLIYRQPAIEVVLLTAVAFQIGSGAVLVIRRWRLQRGFVARLQTWSGIYLAFFLCVHVGAILVGRSLLMLDTNFYFAAASFQVPPYQFFFAPYYFFGVLAIFTHVGCALYWRISPANQSARTLAIALPCLGGSVVALLVCLSLAGMIQPVQVPAKYKATFARHVAGPATKTEFRRDRPDFANPF